MPWKQPSPILRNLDNFSPGAFYSTPPSPLLPLQLGTRHKRVQNLMTYCKILAFKHFYEKKSWPQIKQNLYILLKRNSSKIFVIDLLKQLRFMRRPLIYELILNFKILPTLKKKLVCNTSWANGVINIVWTP